MEELYKQLNHTVYRVSFNIVYVQFGKYLYLRLGASLRDLGKLIYMGQVTSVTI